MLNLTFFRSERQADMKKGKSEFEVPMPTDVADVLNNHLDAFGEFASQFTVPIMGSDLVEGEKWHIGTGVLLELFGHLFVLTAGHCVMAYENAKDIHFGARNSPKITTYEYTYIKNGQIRDWGYLEIDKHDAQASVGRQKRFLSKGDLIVLPPSDLKKEIETRVVIAGFPQAPLENNEPLQFLKLITFPEGFKLDFPKNPNFQNGVNMLIADKSSPSDEELIDTCRKSGLSFRGMSGGGVWIPKSKNSAWLAGILSGGDETYPDVCLGVSVGSVLKLIAESEDTPKDLRQSILSEWFSPTENDKWIYS